MTENSQAPQSKLSDEAIAELIQSLLHKQGSWVDWGKACQKLQNSGVKATTIFEETGFQASQQNLVIVAVQVYESLIAENTSDEVLSYFRGAKSDILYEYRILNQKQRAIAAIFTKEKNLDLDESRVLAKAYKDFSYLSQLPEGFTNHPGDAAAYQSWKVARQKKDLQQRTRLIAKGLKYAYSPTAREKVEKLLSDFSVTPSRSAPMLPVYRLEVEEELPRIVPVAGTLPLKKADLDVSQVELSEPWKMISISGGGSFIPLPGWQAILTAENPVVILTNSDSLPKTLGGKSEEVLVVIDKSQTIWDVNSYFVVEKDNTLTIEWFEESPSLDLLGKVILILRPKKILDENNITEPWQMDD